MGGLSRGLETGLLLCGCNEVGAVDIMAINNPKPLMAALLLSPEPLHLIK